MEQREGTQFLLPFLFLLAHRTISLNMPFQSLRGFYVEMLEKLLLCADVKKGIYFHFSS